MFLSWVRGLIKEQPKHSRRVPARRTNSFRPSLEALESRDAPATYTYTWSAPTIGQWNYPANWTNGTVRYSRTV